LTVSPFGPTTTRQWVLANLTSRTHRTSFLEDPNVNLRFRILMSNLSSVWDRRPCVLIAQFLLSGQMLLSIWGEATIS